MNYLILHERTDAALGEVPTQHVFAARNPTANESSLLTGCWHGYTVNVDFWIGVVGLHPKGLQENL